MSNLTAWRTLSVVALAMLWLADVTVFVLEFRKQRHGPLFWASAASILFLGVLTLADWRSAQLEQAAEQQMQWRALTDRQREILISSLQGHSFEVWVSFVRTDPEAAAFHADLEAVLKQAGLKTKFFSGWERAVGLKITDVPGPDHDVLLAAFRNAGLPVIPEPPVMVIVGSKPPPE